MITFILTSLLGMLGIITQEAGDACKWLMLAEIVLGAVLLIGVGLRRREEPKSRVHVPEGYKSFHDYDVK